MQKAGPQEVLFRELQMLEDNSFRFQTDQTALENVEEFAVNLKYYPAKHIFTGDTLFFDYDPVAIQRVLNELNDPTNMNIMITTKLPFNGSIFDTVEPWFGTEYTTIDYPSKWHALFRNAEAYPDFKLPPPNSYIATDFSISYNKEKSTVTEHPKKIFENSIGELWYRQDDRFLLPIAYYYIYFISPVARGSIER